MGLCPHNYGAGSAVVASPGFDHAQNNLATPFALCTCYLSDQLNVFFNTVEKMFTVESVERGFIVGERGVVLYL